MKINNLASGILWGQRSTVHYEEQKSSWPSEVTTPEWAHSAQDTDNVE